MSGRYFSSYDGKTVMADVDVNGNSLELTIEDEKVKAIGNIPVGGGDDSVWTSETSNALADDDGDDILDENAEAIGDEDAETLWATRDGVGFKAKRAEADINGNSLELHVNDEGKIDKIGDKYIEGTGEAPVDSYSKEETDALLANKQDALSGLPTVAANKYLQTDANQSIVWGNLPAEKDEVAIYSYGSNASGIYSDYQQGKAVFCKYKSTKLIPLTGVGSNCYSFDGVINNDGGVSYSGPRFIHIELAGTSLWSMKVFKIPEPSSSYANRVLTVDSDGAPQWVAPATMTGASAQSAGSSGLVPAPAAGDEEKFLKGDGTWQVASMNEAPESDIDELFDPAGTVRIGGRLYKTIIMDNQEWLAENLDYKFEYNGAPLPVGGSGTPSTPAAWYYSNNEESYGIDGTYKCGLLYNGYAVDYLEANKATLLPAGWHVPSKSEWETMQEHIGGSSVGGTKLKAIPGSLDGNWPSERWGGTDVYEFTAYPGGEMWKGDFHHIDTDTQFWTTTVKTGSYVWAYMLQETSPVLFESSSLKTAANSIRLVKTLS